MNIGRNLFHFIFIVVILLSCSPKITTYSVPTEEVVIFPPQPAQPRIQFLTSISSSVDLHKTRSKFKSYILGKEEVYPVNKPYGICVKNGKIYICDTMLGGLEIINLSNGQFSYFTPEGFGKFKKPINCDVDENDNLYVVDVGRKQVIVFDFEGNFLYSFGEKEFDRPTDIKISGEHIYISDLKKQKIFVYTKKDYRLRQTFPDTGEGMDGYLYSPTNIYVTNDRIYVSDIGDFRVKIFDREGNYISSVGGYGKQPGQFIRPKGIAVDSNNILHVVDAGFENVQMFNDKGKLLMFYGGNYHGKGGMWLPAKVTIDYDNINYFKDYVHLSFNIKYLIFVTNQFGPDKINVYAFIEPKDKKNNGE